MTQFTGPLKANCLLTRHPVLFISEKAGLPLILETNTLGIWPSIAAEHGYETWNLKLPRLQSQTENILSGLSRLKSKAHVICDSKLKAKLEKACAKSPTLKQNIKSITYLENDPQTPLLQQRDFILQHLGSLAEFDFIETT